MWFNEYKEYVEKDVDPLRYVGSWDPKMQELGLATTNGHFTAIVNAATDRIGCGMTRGGRDNTGMDPVYVCNYHPQGNIMRRLRSGRADFIPAYPAIVSLIFQDFSFSSRFKGSLNICLLQSKAH